MSAGGQPARAGRYPGLLEKLMAAVRPEFRAEVIAVDPADLVFGGPPCQVASCIRVARVRGICLGHYHRWKEQGYPGIAGFIAATDPAIRGRRPVPRCDVPGCSYGRRGAGLCTGHHAEWLEAGKPGLPAWLAALPGRTVRRRSGFR